jgi:UDP-N-acetylmuramate dehydrogenase
MNIKKNRSLKEFNTFGVDSTVEHFLKITAENELYDSFKYIEKNKLSYFILGGGSNVLLTFKKFKGAVIYIQNKGIEIVSENEEEVIIDCAAGEVWDDLVTFCVDRNLGGMENMSHIPGTVGAAPIQNIGAYGQELKESFDSAKIYLINEKKFITLHKNECRFDYRDSIFKREMKNKAVIINVTLKVKKNPKPNFSYKGVREIIFKTGEEKPTILDIRNAVIELRKEKLPDPEVLGNAGSFFKNPEIAQESFNILKKFSPDIEGFKTKDGYVKISAAKLIELSGWKGRRDGSCGVYENHSLVLVNYGNAEGSQISGLADKIITDVYSNFGIKLTTEVNFVI